MVEVSRASNCLQSGDVVIEILAIEIFSRLSNELLSGGFGGLVLMTWNWLHDSYITLT